jgi:hypothetical protein
MVHEFPGWTDELRSLQVPTLLIFDDRDFSPLPTWWRCPPTVISGRRRWRPQVAQIPQICMPSSHDQRRAYRSAERQCALR